MNQIKTISISSKFIENNNFHITPEEFITIEKNITTRLGKAIIADWKNWHKIDKVNTKNTQLADPVTLYLALNPEQIKKSTPKTISFPCLNKLGKLKSELSGCWYSMPGLDNKLIQLNNSTKSLSTFVSTVQSSEMIKEKIKQAILSY